MISVILPVYNCEKYLSEAIESVLNQTFKDFELICINDGSTDNTSTILEYYSKLDSRVTVVSRPNKGLIYSLNEGIRLSKYDFIARMDADDICKETRLEQQLSFLIDNPDVGLLGTGYRYIDECGSVIGKRSPPKYKFTIYSSLIFGSPFCHPSVMFNRSVLGDELLYDNEYLHAEDYELWTRLVPNYKVRNLNSELLDYRVLNTSISRENKLTQRNSMQLAAAKLIKSKYTELFLHSSFYESSSFLAKLSILLKQKRLSFIVPQLIFLLKNSLRKG